MTALIFLVLIGLLVAWVVGRGRTKMKLPMTGKHWFWIVIVVVIVLAVVYGANNVPHATHH